MNIEKFDRLTGSPAIIFATREWLRLAELGLTDPTELCMTWDNSVLLARDEHHNQVGIIIYQWVEWRRQVWIQLGAVVPGMRGRGVYRALWECLIEESRKLGARKIEGATHVNNIEMNAVAERLGRRHVHNTWSFDLPPSVPDERRL